LKLEPETAAGYFPRMPQPDSTSELNQALAERIFVLDGAMGTTIRTYGLTEADARGKRFADTEKDLLNNGDILSLTRPEVIGDIHKRFYEAGSDICETNTFSATSIAQSEFFVEDPRENGGRKDPEFFQKIIEDPFLNELAWEMNVESARSAGNGRTTSARTPAANATSPERSGRSRFPSPTRRTPTTRLPRGDLRPGAGGLQTPDPRAHRGRLRHPDDRNDLRFPQRQGRAVAVQEIYHEQNLHLPLIISAAVGLGGETMISAQKVEAFWNAFAHTHPLAIGLNCSLGPDLMRPHLEELSDCATTHVSCYPNAGLPNPLAPTGFDLEPHHMEKYMADFADAGLLNLAGGCCGNTPDHIAAIAKGVAGKKPREVPVVK
jgi:5-methyltetrahydrofolate--homocysteine methyltransferase